MLPDLPPETTTAQLLRRAASRSPIARPTSTASGASRNAARSCADGFATTLIDRGVRPGDVVCLMLPSSIEVRRLLPRAHCASARSRRDQPATRCDRGRKHHRPHAAGAHRARRRRGVTRRSRRGTCSASPICATRSPPTPPPRLPPRSPTDPTCIVWTSGTTGAPKGAVYDHETQAAISRNIGQITEHGDRRLVVLPFAHVGYMTRMWDELARPHDDRARRRTVVGDRDAPPDS